MSDFPRDAKSSHDRGKTIAYGLAGAAAIGCALAVPFLVVPWLPRKVFGALPWLPTSAARVNLMLDFVPPHVVLPGKRFIDLGAGDGVAVIEAAKRGMSSVGVELNPTLVLMSRVAARQEGVSKLCTFNLGDLWATPISDFDLVMVFGVIPMMPRLKGKLEAELKEDAYVCSHKFPLVGWENRLLGTVNDMHIYHWSRQNTTSVLK